MATSLEQELADGLKAAGAANMTIRDKYPSASEDELRDKSMENVAKPIADAIQSGGTAIFVASVDYLNALKTKRDDVIYRLSDSGTLDGNVKLPVSKADLVYWVDNSWVKVGTSGSSPTPSTDGYTKAEVNALIASEAARATAEEAELNDNKENKGVAAVLLSRHVFNADPHAQYALKTALTAHTGDNTRHVNVVLGSHPSITFDFTGSYGTDADTFYWV